MPRNLIRPLGIEPKSLDISQLQRTTSPWAQIILIEMAEAGFEPATSGL